MSDDVLSGFGTTESQKVTQRARLMLSAGPALIIVPIKMTPRDAERLKGHIDLFAEPIEDVKKEAP